MGALCCREESDGEGDDDFGSDAAEELGDEIEGGDSDLELLEEAPPPKRKRAAQGTLQARAVALLGPFTRCVLPHSCLHFCPLFYSCRVIPLYLHAAHCSPISSAVLGRCRTQACCVHLLHLRALPCMAGVRQQPPQAQCRFCTSFASLN